MAFIVLVAGIGVAAIGLLGVAAPSHLTHLLTSWRLLTGFSVTIVARIGFGVLFLVAAPDCRLPDLVRAIGVLELMGAVGLVLIGSERLRRFVAWWLERPARFVRVWCSGALLFGVLIAYAGA